MSPFAIKSAGYVLSMASVLLLGVVSWHSAGGDPLLAAALAGGVATSIGGMGLRWFANSRQR